MFSVQVTHPCPGSHFLHEVIADDNISEGVGECPSGIFAQWEKKASSVIMRVIWFQAKSVKYTDTSDAAF